MRPEQPVPILVNIGMDPITDANTSYTPVHLTRVRILHVGRHNFVGFEPQLLYSVTSDLFNPTWHPNMGDSEERWRFWKARWVLYQSEVGSSVCLRKLAQRRRRH